MAAAEKKDDTMEITRTLGRGIIEVHTVRNEETDTGDRDQQEISSFNPGATSTPAPSRFSLKTEIEKLKEENTSLRRKLKENDEDKKKMKEEMKLLKEKLKENEDEKDDENDDDDEEDDYEKEMEGRPKNMKTCRHCGENFRGQGLSCHERTCWNNPRIVNIWNNLPLFVKTSECLSIFKSRLRKHLLNKYLSTS